MAKTPPRKAYVEDNDDDGPVGIPVVPAPAPAAAPPVPAPTPPRAAAPAPPPTAAAPPGRAPSPAPAAPPADTADKEEDEDEEEDGVSQRDAAGILKQLVDATNSRPIEDGQGKLLGRPDREEEVRYAGLLASLDPEPPFWTRWVGSAGVVWGGILLAATLALFVLAQASLLISQVGSLPTALQYLGYSGAVLLLGTFVLAAVRLVMLYLRLRRSPAFRTDTLYQLAAREQIRAGYTRRAFKYVFDGLRPILTDYPLGEAAVKKLRVYGADDALIESLRAAKEALAAVRESDELWVEGFRTRFLPVLDAIAARRIRSAAFTAGKLTALSPRGTMDAVVVATLAVGLVGDLCAIYSLRANRVDTVRILALVLMTAGVAGQADDLAQSAAGQLFETLHTDTSWITAVLGKIAAPVTGGIADGVVNGALMYRLGRLTVRALRPLR
jgi:uncharacterized membrane protein YcjF (UPF0283 family)